MERPLKTIAITAVAAALMAVGMVGAAHAERIPFDDGWEFAMKDFWLRYAKVGLSTPQNSANDNGTPRVRADAEGWKAVTLPHDWALSLPYSEQASRSGYRALGRAHPENNVGWYRKTFAVPKDAESGRTYIQFDGVYRDAQFWMNGMYLGRNDSGYSERRFDVTDVLDYGSTNNFVCVRVDASKDEGWWYDGAGIYRHVWLIRKHARHILPRSVFGYATDVSQEKARLKLAACASEPDGEMRWTLLGPDGAAVATANAKVGAGGECAAEMEVASPRLWSPDEPTLYTLVTEYLTDGKATDAERTTIGIRSVVFDPDRGLVLNGKRVQVRGVCCHQDHAGVGVAVPDAIQDYRVRRLKEMGVNAYRTSHNPPTPELLDACDRHGLLVMDETRFFSSTEEGLSQFERLIVRDRNHPCVVAWSLGNEEHNVQNGDFGRRMAEAMKRAQRRLDPSRVTTYGGNNGGHHSGVNEAVDVRGVNYIRLVGVDNGAFDKYHADHPATPVWGSEEASTLCTRGSDFFVGGKGRQILPDTDTVANRPSGWAYSAEEWTTRAEARPWFAGAFAWTGFDYRGESHWPAVINNFGILDLCGFPKNNAYYYQARWTDKDVLHIYPHPNAARTNFWVNTNCDSVELFVNGRSVGRQNRADGVYRLSFPVDFASGTVEARGMRNGREVREMLKTSGRAVQVKATADRTVLAADGVDATVVNLTACDADGNEVFDASNRLYFDSEGAGRILGLGNGDPIDHDSDVREGKYGDGVLSRRFFNGKCQVVIQSASQPGRFALSWRGDGMADGKIEIDVK